MSTLRDELIALGRSIVDGEHDPDAATQQLSRYAALFHRWHEEEGPGAPSKSQNVRDLEEVQSVHDAVLAYAVKLRDQTDKSLKGLKQRGKTILAYVDTLPKRVSITKPNKG